MTISGNWRKAAEFAGLIDANGVPLANIFEAQTIAANQAGAINLGQGFPDEDGPIQVLDAAKAAIDAGANQYPPGRGIPALREAIAAHQARFYGLTVDPDLEVMVTAGATEAIAATLLGLAEPGDEVITFEPYYDEYAAVIGLSGAKHVRVPLDPPAFLPDLGRLAAAFGPKTRAILINNPINPTGTILPTPVLAEIVRLCELHGVTIISDEVYEHLIFGDAHTPIATVPGARERTVTISSAAKTFSVTGWKIGWLTAPAEIVTAIFAVKQYLTYANGAPFQPAIALGLGLGDGFYAGLATKLRDKRDLIVSALKAAGFGVFVPEATYFVVADAAPLGATDGVAFARELIDRVGVASIPVTAFVGADSADHYRTLVRFAFCKKTEVLEEAARRLAKLQTSGV